MATKQQSTLNDVEVITVIRFTDPSTASQQMSSLAQHLKNEPACKGVLETQDERIGATVGYIYWQTRRAQEEAFRSEALNRQLMALDDNAKISNNPVRRSLI